MYPFRCNNESVGPKMIISKRVKDNKLFVNLTNIMVIHIMNSMIVYFSQSVLRD